MEQHVTNKELSKILKAHGVPQVSEFYWSKNAQYGWQLVSEKFPKEDGEENGMTDGISAFLASELGEMLPCYLEIENEGRFLRIRKIQAEWASGWGIGYTMRSEDGNIHQALYGFQSDERISNAMAKMLDYLYTNKLI